MTGYKQWNNVRVARRLIIITCIFWFIYNIPSFIYFEAYQNSCVLANPIYHQYYTYFHMITILICMPLFVIMMFAILAYRQICTSIYHLL